MKCPKCTDKLVKVRWEMLDEKGDMWQAGDWICWCPKCGHEEKAEPETVENPDEGP